MRGYSAVTDIVQATSNNTFVDIEKCPKKLPYLTFIIISLNSTAADIRLKVSLAADLLNRRIISAFQGFHHICSLAP